LIPLFGWVLTPFVKACLEVSRDQELAADRFAAEHFGADTLRQAIAKTRQLETDYGLYFQSEVLPVIHAGYATPLLEGFAQFREGLRQGLEPRFRLGVKTDAQPAATNLPAMSPEFLTHPDFETRLEAIQNDGWSNRLPDERPAVALLEDLPALELRLLNGEAQKRGLGTLKPLPWSEVGERVYLAQWREFARRHGDLLDGAAMRDLPALVRRAEELGGRLQADSEQALQYLSAASCAALAEEGWQLSYKQAGAPRAFTKNGQQVDMFTVIEKLAWEEMASFEWEDQAEALGIADVRLDATSASHAG
jgi:Peptidase family M48